MLKPAILFQSRMVLQREKEVRVWGSCDSQEKVTVSIQGLSAEGFPDAEGRWCVGIGPLKASFSETLRISSGAEVLEYDDVQVGDVWLAAGQSNMEFFMRYDADYAAKQPVCANESLRFFDYPEVSYPGQIGEADYGKNFGFWRKASPENLEWFSAAAYYFAKEIQTRYGIPVGIVGCNWGGTPACAWMSREAILEGGGEAWIQDYEAGLAKIDLTAYEEQFRANPASFRTDPFADPFGDGLMRGKSFEEILFELYGQRIDPGAVDFSALVPPVGPKHETRPSGLYESMLMNVAPYTLKGILYYQGESDGDSHPELYETMFPALIRGFRSLWGEELPFLFVQIAPFGRWMQCSGEPYPAIRKAQQSASERVPGTGMAVISDIGMEWDIHPKKKQPVGHRLALQAMQRVYGEAEVLCEAPSLVRGEMADGELRLYFANAGEGLYLAGRTPDQAETDPRRLGGLEVFLEGKPLDLSAVTAEAGKDSVVLRGELFRKERKAEVRLGCTAWYRINLYNSADIPARPAAVTVSVER